MTLTAMVVKAVSEGSGAAGDPFMPLTDFCTAVVAPMAQSLGIDEKAAAVPAVGDLFNRKYANVFREPAERSERQKDLGRTSKVRLFSMMDAAAVVVFLVAREFGVDIATAKAIVDFAVNKWYPANSVMAEDALQLEKGSPLRPRDMVAVHFHKGEIVLHGSDGTDDLANLLAMARFRPVMLINLARVFALAKLYTEDLWEKRSEEVAELLRQRKRSQDVAAEEEGNMGPGIRILRSPLRLRLAGKDADGQLVHATVPLSAASVLDLAIAVANEKGKGDRSAFAIAQEAPGLYIFGDPPVFSAVWNSDEGDRIRIGFSLTAAEAMHLLGTLKAALAGEEIANSQFDAEFLSAMRISPEAAGTAKEAV